MRQYAIRRLSFFVPVLLVTTAITFVAVNVVPGDHAQLVLGFSATQEDLDAFREEIGLNDPLWQRYLTWVGGMLTGDPGQSYFGGIDIVDEVRARLPVTLSIMVFAFTFTMFFGVTFGVIAAVFQDRFPDYFVRTFSIFGLSIPEFFTLTLLALVPAILWGYAPNYGYVPIWEDPMRNLEQIVPPTLVLAIGSSATLMRLTRSAMLEVLRQDYIRTARSKGLRERTVLVRHAVKNAAIPVLTIAGLLIANLLGGSIILEQITGLPGLGRYTLNAIINKDFNVILTMTTYAAFLIMSANLAVDLLYGFVDPRIRYR